MQKFEFLRQPLLGELAMSWKRERKRERREKNAIIVATYVSASSQGQRTHSARTKNLSLSVGYRLLWLLLQARLLNTGDCCWEICWPGRISNNRHFEKRVWWFCGIWYLLLYQGTGEKATYYCNTDYCKTSTATIPFMGMLLIMAIMVISQ